MGGADNESKRKGTKGVWPPWGLWGEEARRDAMYRIRSQGQDTQNGRLGSGLVSTALVVVSAAGGAGGGVGPEPYLEPGDRGGGRDSC